MSPEQQSAMNLLKHMKTIEGSQSAKLYIQNEIWNYFRYFGLPQLFFTFNPSPAHSPIFVAMCGDKSIDLSEKCPVLPSTCDRAIMLAKDPVATADFFEFCMTALFKYLFVWDYNKQSPKAKGGILGQIYAFYSTTEFTEQGCLHGYFLIWLVGGMNSFDLYNVLNGVSYQKRFLDFLRVLCKGN